MMTYEWKALESETPMASEQIEAFGLDGWELFQILPYNDGYLTYLRKAKAIQ